MQFYFYLIIELHKECFMFTKLLKTMSSASRKVDFQKYILNQTVCEDDDDYVFKT